MVLVQDRRDTLPEEYVRAMGIEVRVLGPVEVVCDGEPVAIGGPMQKTVLATLVAAAGDTVSLDRLIDAAYGEDAPSGAKRTIHTYISNLRRVVGEALQRNGLGYRVDPQMIDLDCRRFLDTVHTLRDGGVRRTADRVRELRDAESWWRSGTAFDGVEDHGVLAPDRALLEEARLEAMSLRIDAELSMGRHADLVPELRALVSRLPMVETYTAQLMVALYRSGRPTEALRAFESTRRHLASEMGVEPSPMIRTVQEQVLTHDPLLMAPNIDDRPRRSTSFIGRTALLEDIQEAMESGRSLTLIGPGGVGKTSIAHELAARVRDGFDLVVRVDFDAAERASDIAHLLMQALRVERSIGVDPAASVSAAIGDRRCLLVLDTCEHVVDEVARIVSRILGATPNTHVVATSRRGLGHRGELLIAINPFSELETEDAISLFVERARLVRPDFELTDSSRDVIDFVVRRLDGLPLAIELAAARVRWFGIEEVETALRQRGGPALEHQGRDLDRTASLARSIDWSVDLLSEEAQRGFRCLSVVRTAFTHDDAIAILNSVVGDAQSVLLELLDASLMSRNEFGFEMLDTIRDHASVALAGSADERLCALAMVDRLAELANALDADRSQRLPQATILQPANIRAALDWAIEHEPDAAFSLVAATSSWFWWFGSRVVGHELLERITSALPVPTSHAGYRVAYSRTMHAVYFGEEVVAREWSENVLRLAEELGDPALKASAMQNEAFVVWQTSMERAVELNEEAARVFERLASPVASYTYGNLANLAVYRGASEAVEVYSEHMERLGAQHSQEDVPSRVAGFRAAAANLRGDLARAEEILTAAIDDYRGPAVFVPFIHLNRANIRAWRGDAAGAADDLDAVGWGGEWAEAPYSLELRSAVGSTLSVMYRKNGQLSSAATALRSALDITLANSHVLEFFGISTVDLLVEAVLVLGAAGVDDADTAIASLKAVLRESRRGLPRHVLEALREVEARIDPSGEATEPLPLEEACRHVVGLLESLEQPT